MITRCTYAGRLAREAAQSLQAAISKGENPGHAWNNNSVQLVAAAKVRLEQQQLVLAVEVRLEQQQLGLTAEVRLEQQQLVLTVKVRLEQQQLVLTAEVRLEQHLVLTVEC